MTQSDTPSDTLSDTHSIADGCGHNITSGDGAASKSLNKKPKATKKKRFEAGQSVHCKYAC